MVAALIDHIEVYHAEKQDGITNQRVDMFAIETHPFISDVSMTFACFFRGLCAFLCAFGKIAQFENTHFAMKSCKKP